MNILVLYFSKSGNTEKLASEIARGVEENEGVSAVLRSASEVSKEDFLGSAGVIAGSPVYFGTMAWPLKKIFDDYVGLRKKMEGKVGAAFATSGDDTGGKETTIFSIIQAMLIYGMLICGDPMDATGHYGTACTGEPDEKIRNNARKFGRRVAEVAARLHA